MEAEIKRGEAGWRDAWRWLWLLVLVALVLGGCQKRPRVEVISPKRGEIRESFSEPARTRLERTWLVSMPIGGRIGRIDLEPGDHVTTGQTLAEFDVLPLKTAANEARAAVEQLQAELRLNAYDALEQTALVEARAFVEATSQTLKASDAQVAAQDARSRRANLELERIERLSKTQTVAVKELDDARLAAETALIDLRRQQFLRAAMTAVMVIAQLGPEYIEKWLVRKHLQRDSLTAQLAQARERVARAEHDLQLARLESPIAGVVLERREQGDGTLPVGQALLLLGNLEFLEAVADVLTQDALRLTTGSLVELEAAARRPAIRGHVKRIEPQGFTKLSSLGVEQQRVHVLIALDEHPADLGVGYRLDARFYTATRAGALIVPRFSVLQAPDQSFYVFKVSGGVLKHQPVEIGLRNDLQMEVVRGLSEADTLVAAPDTTLSGGEEVQAVRQQ